MEGIDQNVVLNATQLAFALAVHVLTLAFFIGAFWMRVRNLERKVDDAITHGMNSLDKKLDEVQSCVAHIKGYIEGRQALERLQAERDRP